MPNVSTLSMMLEVDLDASGVVKGARIANKALDELKSKANGVGKSLTTSGKDLGKTLDKASIALGAVGAGLTGAGMAAWNGLAVPMMQASGEFQSALRNFQNITEATDKQLGIARESAIAFGSASVNSATEVVQMMARIGAAGNSMEETLKRAPILLKAIAVSMGDLDPEEGARAFEGLMVKFREEGVTYQKIADQIMQATNKTMLEWRDIPIMVRSMRDAPEVLKVTMSDFLSLVGALRNAMTSADAAQNLKAFGRRMILVQSQINKDLIKNKISEREFMQLNAEDLKESGQFSVKKAVEAFKKFNVAFFDTATGEKRRAIDILGDFAARSAEIIKNEGFETYITNLNALFADNARTVVNALLKYGYGSKLGAEALNKLSEATANSTGKIDLALDNVMKSSEMKMKKLKATWSTFLSTTGEGVSNTFGGIADAIQGVLESFNKFTAAHPGFANALGKTIVYGTAILTIFGGITLLFASIAFWVSYIKPALVGLFSTTFMATAGVVITKIAIIAAVLGGLYLALKSFMDLAGVEGSALGNLSKMFSNFGDVVSGVLEFWNADTGGRKSKFDELRKKGLLPLVEAILNIKMAIGAIVTGFMQVLKVVLFPIGAFIYGIIRSISFAVEGLGKFFGLIENGNGPLGHSLKYWNVIGNIIGVVVVKGLLVYLGYLAISITRQTILTAQTAIMNAKWVLIVAAVTAYVALLYAASKFGEQLGGWAADFKENMSSGFMVAKEFNKLPANLRTPEVQQAYSAYGIAASSGESNQIKMAQRGVDVAVKSAAAESSLGGPEGLSGRYKDISPAEIKSLARAIGGGKDTGGVVSTGGKTVSINSITMQIKSDPIKDAENFKKEVIKSLESAMAKAASTGAKGQ